MTHQKVLITGMGAVSAAGGDLPSSLRSMAGGIRNHSEVTLFETPLGYPVFEARALPSEYILEGQRTLGLALCAAAEAMRGARLDGGFEGLKVGVCMGTTVASQLNDIEFYRAYREAGSAGMEPVQRFLKGNLAEFLAARLNASGPSLTVVNACSSGADAIGAALSWLRTGLCDIALAGGADELNRVPLAGFGSLGIVSKNPCAPFDRARDGLNLGEGAGVVVLETEESAAKRGIRPTLALLGYGSSADAHHLTAPHPEGAGLRKAIRRALEEAGVRPLDVCFVNAHGTATRDNDKVEGRALLEIFGQGVKAISTKGFTGHTLGAAGGLEAVFTASALREGWIPPSAGFVDQDEEIGLTPVIEKTVISGRCALSTSLAFGGNNAALLLSAEG